MTRHIRVLLNASIKMTQQDSCAQKSGEEVEVNQLLELTEAEAALIRRRFYEAAHGEPTWSGYGGEVDRQHQAQVERNAEQDAIEREWGAA